MFQVRHAMQVAEDRRQVDVRAAESEALESRAHRRQTRQVQLATRIRCPELDSETSELRAASAR